MGKWIARNDRVLSRVESFSSWRCFMCGAAIAGCVFSSDLRFGVRHTYPCKGI